MHVVNGYKHKFHYGNPINNDQTKLKSILLGVILAF